MTAADLSTVPLPGYSQSKSRKIAERLVELGRASQIELAEYAAISRTSVTRVVKDMQEIGYEIERSTDQDRRAWYEIKRVPNAAPAPEAQVPARPALRTLTETVTEDDDGGPVEFVGVTPTEDGKFCLTFRWGGRELEGITKGSVPFSILAGTARVMRSSVHPAGFAVLHIGDSTETLLVRMAISPAPIG